MSTEAVIGLAVGLGVPLLGLLGTLARVVWVAATTMAELRKSVCDLTAAMGEVHTDMRHLDGRVDRHGERLAVLEDRLERTPGCPPRRSSRASIDPPPTGGYPP